MPKVAYLGSGDNDIQILGLLILHQVFFPYIMIDIGRLEVGIYPTKPPGILLVPETLYSFSLYFPDPM